jgi:predicted nucleic-acid-binding protein
MKITADTNVLVRACVCDDERQARKAVQLLGGSESVAVSLHALCELSWVLLGSYGVRHSGVASAIRSLIGMDNVVTDRPAVEAGLAILEAGGDFADGVVAHDGRALNGGVFVSFDKKAVKRIQAQGHKTQLV